MPHAGIEKEPGRRLVGGGGEWDTEWRPFARDREKATPKNDWLRGGNCQNCGEPQQRRGQLLSQKTTTERRVVFQASGAQWGGDKRKGCLRVTIGWGEKKGGGKHSLKKARGERLFGHRAKPQK